MTAATTTASTAATASPVRAVDAEAAGRQVEEILDRLEADGGPGSRAAGDELVRALMRFYGAGLARVLDLLAAPHTAAPHTAPLEALLADSRVAALLTLHDLHPEDLRTRVERALTAVPGQPFELVGLDEATATVTVRRAEAAGCGCPNTLEAGRESVEAALACFAPEATVMEMDADADAASVGPLLQIGARPETVSGAGR
jgi:hypothetical protein